MSKSKNKDSFVIEKQDADRARQRAEEIEAQKEARQKRRQRKKVSHEENWVAKLVAPIILVGSILISWIIWQW